MSNVYYPQSKSKPKTLTVRELISALQMCSDKELPVIFRSPDLGVYGSGTNYALSSAKIVDLPESVVEFGESEHNYVKHAWKGVVVS